MTPLELRAVGAAARLRFLDRLLFALCAAAVLGQVFSDLTEHRWFWGVADGLVALAAMWRSMR